MLISANFGSTRTGLETVGYKILNADKTEYAGRTTTGVTELGGGVYGVQVADADLTGRYVVWDSGEASPVYAAEGFGMTLADDAITAATFDEATAFPLTAADTGATILARAGAKMDLVDAPNATALGAIKDAVQGAGTTLATLLSRIIGTLATGTHNPQTGDAYARLGAAGAGLTALGDARLANLDAAVSGREASGAAAAAVVGLSTFNPATDEVDVGKVKGVGVTDIDDFKADVSGLSTLTEEDLPSEPPSAATIATAVWAAVERTLTAFGFEVEATVDEEALAAAIVAAIGDEGLVDETALANAVVAALGALTVTITSPVAADGTITIYQVSDY